MRLRRDVRGFALGYHLELVFAGLALYILLQGTQAVLVVIAVLMVCVPLLQYVPSRFVLREKHLDAGNRLANQMPFRCRVDRSHVVQAYPGVVPWGLGGEVAGIELLLSDDRRVGLPMSALMGERRTQAWIDSINTWAESGNQD